MVPNHVLHQLVCICYCILTWLSLVISTFFYTTAFSEELGTDKPEALVYSSRQLCISYLGGWPADYFMTGCQEYLVADQIDEMEGIREQQARMAYH